MLQVVRYVLLIFIGIAACSCDHFEIKGLFMPTGDGVEKRFEQSRNINSELNNGHVDATESYIFYVAADPHINKTHRNLTIFNDTLREDTEASFGVILGDCSDVRDNLHNYLEALSYDPDRHACDHNIFHILGNHDTYFRGWDDFKKMIGPSVYWFEVVFTEGKDLYIALDTATGTLGRKQMQWLKKFLGDNRRNYRHCIILTHTNFFYTDNSQTTSGNLPIEETYALVDLLDRHDVSLVLQGHDHYREDFTYANVRYTVLGTIKDSSKAPEYLKVIVNHNNIGLEWQYIR